ncbi:hypothetical protein PAEPH01_1490 [Pancytospora epiphaga]|nr:hypothetical protein PAEPH01_1490 [Pancytospora epiphaga]
MVNTKIGLLKKKVNHQLAALRQDMIRKFRSECLSLFNHNGIPGLPLLLYIEALERNFGEKEVTVLEKNKNNSKQKISIKVGSKKITIGDYDEENDGDLLEYVTSECVKRRNTKNPHV